MEAAADTRRSGDDVGFAKRRKKKACLCARFSKSASDFLLFEFVERSETSLQTLLQKQNIKKKKMQQVSDITRLVAHLVCLL